MAPPVSALTYINVAAPVENRHACALQQHSMAFGQPEVPSWNPASGRSRIPQCARAQASTIS